MCRCLWVKTRSNRDKIWKSWQFCGSDFGSRFLATKMGVKSFYKKKLKGNRGRLHFGSRFWLPDLVVRSSSFFVFLSYLAAGRAESVLELRVRAGRS
jgi:hypothetical protein